MLRLSRHARQLRHLSRRAQQAPPRSGSGGKSGAEPVPVVASQIVHITWGTYARPVAFAFAGSTAAFAYAAWYEKPPLARALEMQRRVRDAGRKMELATNPLEKLRHFWDTLPDSKRLISGVVCANVAVFALWRIRPLAAVMRRFFLHEAWTGRSLQLLGSAFSHKGALHLGVNMYAFYTFASGLYPVMGPEHLTAFYLSAGLMAAVSSHVLTLLRPAAMIGSLGASGAVYGLFGFMAAKYPDVKVLQISSFEKKGAEKNMIALNFFWSAVFHSFCTFPRVHQPADAVRCAGIRHCRAGVGLAQSGSRCTSRRTLVWAVARLLRRGDVQEEQAGCGQHHQEIALRK
eukprot:m.90640 g.90640  ORF g.90640 m.90640 type:complete len:346 (+) comp18175_c0_seq3:93-1130(+)